MSDPDNDRLRNFVESQVDNDSICTAYVLVATVENIVNGESKFFTLCPPEQIMSTTIGLLESSSAAEKLRMAKHLLNED